MRMRSGAWLALGTAGIVLLATGPADAQKKTLDHRAEPGSGHPGPDARPHVRRAHHLRAHVREALRDRREPQDLPAARGGAAALHRRRQDRHDQASRRREVQRRHADDRRGGEVLARPSPGDEGVQSPKRAGSRRRGRGRRSDDRPPASEGAVLADHRHPRRPRRHAGLADPGAEARRQVRDRARVRRPLGVHRARRPGPDRAGQVHALLRPGPGEVRPARLPDHHGRQRPAGEPALGGHRLHAPGEPDRTRRA